MQRWKLIAYRIAYKLWLYNSRQKVNKTSKKGGIRMNCSRNIPGDIQTQTVCGIKY